MRTESRKRQLCALPPKCNATVDHRLQIFDVAAGKWIFDHGDSSYPSQRVRGDLAGLLLTLFDDGEAAADVDGHGGSMLRSAQGDCYGPDCQTICQSPTVRIWTYVSPSHRCSNKRLQSCVRPSLLAYLGRAIVWSRLTSACVWVSAGLRCARRCVALKPKVS